MNKAYHMDMLYSSDNQRCDKVNYTTTHCGDAKYLVVD